MAHRTHEMLRRTDLVPDRTVRVDEYLTDASTILFEARLWLVREWTEDNSRAAMPGYLVEVLGDIAACERMIDNLRATFQLDADGELSAPVDLALTELLSRLESEGRR
jgi:hypothetical protein